MRKSILASIFLAGLVTLAAPRPALGAVQVSVSVFHQTLAPYGRWITSASYGDVWAPSVAVGWQPYVNGEWYYTDCGWTWASSDPWGEIPFHYGTWVWDPGYGWVWVPGTVWSPAWVTWAYSDDFIGWAPVPPSFGFSVTGYVGSPVVLAANRYVFVPTRQFVGVGVASVRVPLQQNTTIFANTTRTTRFQVSGGVLHNVGPAPQRIARVAGRRIDPVPVARAGVHPVSLSQSGAAQGRRLAVVAPKAERAAAISKSSAASHTRPNRNVESSHAAASAHPSQPPRHAPAKPEKAAAERAVSKPQKPERAAVKTEKASSHAAKPAPRAQKPVAKPPKPEKPQPQPEVARHEASPPEHVTAARPAPKPHAAQAHPQPPPHPQKPNTPKPKQPQKPPHPQNDGNGNGN